MKLRKIIAGSILGLVMITAGTTSVYAAQDNTGQVVSDESQFEKLSSYIVEQLESRADKIDVIQYGISADDVNNLWEKIIYEHPEIYYVSTRINYSYQSVSGKVTKITPTYLTGIDDQAFAAECAKMMSAVDDEMSDLEKALAIHDYIVAECDYDMNANPADLSCTSFSMYGTVVKKLSVCQGYAGTFLYAMNELGIECKMITGGNHAWNLIKIDGEWYHVDCTWDDPYGNIKGKVYHKYFLKSDTYMTNDTSGTAHVWNEEDFPECADTSYDYGYVWDNVYNQMIYNKGVWYYTRFDKNVKYDCYYRYNPDDKSEQKIKQLSGRWLAPDSKTVYYPGCTMITTDGRYIYYTTNNSIRVMNFNGSGDKTLIKLNNLGNGRIYGINYNRNIIRYDILSKASDSKLVYSRSYTSLPSAFIRGTVLSGVNISYSSSNVKVVTAADGGKISMKGIGTALYYVKTSSGTYPATMSRTYLKINRQTLAKSSIRGMTTRDYTGKVITPAVSVYIGGEKINPKYYSVSYLNNKAIGTATVRITGKGLYNGSKTATFIIRPPKVRIKSVKSGSARKVTIKYLRASRVDGYQIYRASSANGKYSCVATVNKGSIVSRTISAPSRKRCYYMVRAYKVVKGKRIYGAFSGKLSCVAR